MVCNVVGAVGNIRLYPIMIMYSIFCPVRILQLATMAWEAKAASLYLYPLQM